METVPGATAGVRARFHVHLAGCTKAIVVTFVLHWPAVAMAQPAGGMPEGFRYEPRDLSRELANKMEGRYTVTAVGDVLMQEPMSGLMSPELVDVLRGSDTTVGNMEVYLVDRRTWPHGFGNNWAPKDMAQDFATMGFDMLVSGEGPGGVEGMKSSIHWLDREGIPLAGYGPNLTIARQPVFQQTVKGRVALVAAYPVPDRGAGSGDDVARGLEGDTGWGLNPLRMTVWNVVTQDQMDQLKSIRDAIVARRHEPDVSRPIRVPEDRPDRVTIFADNHYMVGPKTGEYRYELDPADRRAQILAVRNAKEYSDFAMFSMHVHQNRYAFQVYSQDHYPPQYLIDLTHDMVDNGMDLFFGHGNHTMQGIEIYKGRPIFYNLGNLSVHRFGADYSGDAGPMTSIERSELGSQGLQQPANQRAFVAKVIYQDGFLEELRIYPVDLGGSQGPDRRPWSRTDIPMTPSPQMAREILAEIQEYSRPFRTEIAIEVDEFSRVVGVIRVSRAATVPVGEGLRDTFGN